MLTHQPSPGVCTVDMDDTICGWYNGYSLQWSCALLEQWCYNGLNSLNSP